ncbi:Methyltransferase [Actinidia chinensis var. chinensis]|uniref:Methyltransferase n=1 Tax=Actinidia chinensis var. chinensis TaxID=1590841 RepID=A0A2R6PE49_ACTCC|nr:Methyltransferase [Actinidia chinensis var. chinensis]
MATKGNSGDNRTRNSVSIFIVSGLCCFFYLLGAWQRSGFGKGDSIALEITKKADCSILSNLNIETNHGDEAGTVDDSESESKVFEPCDDRYIDYTPCQDQMRAMTFPRENMNYRERHCPPEEEKLHCLVPAPKGYVTPFPWPKSRDYVPYANAPYKSLTVEKAVQNWIQYEGNVFRFPGGGTQFPHGADAYIDELASVIPIGNGMVRTALDTGCGRPKEELEEEQRKIEEIAKLLCWEKKHEKGEIAVWRKRVNKEYCPEQDSSAAMCEPTSANDVWYKKMEACLTPYPETSGPDEVAGGELKPFPERLHDVPPGIARESVSGVSVESFQDDNKLWKKHLNAYKRVNKIIDSGRYRNIMDMNAGLGSFAAAIDSPKVWVMNVMPTISERDTLGVIYERGMIGIYHDWCEAFSTYPRTYDLIHADGVFNLYKDKCNAEDILLEVDRILRPEGTVIFRDQVDVLVKVKRLATGMRWNTKMVDHEDGPLVPEKVLFAVKPYWVAGQNNSTSSR